MNRFAELLDRLAYEPGRNNKLRLITDYFRRTPDPERGWALAALTGALSFQHAKPGLIRALIAERTDPVLFALSYDYVGDLSETVALMWPARSAAVAGRTRAPHPLPTSSRRCPRSARAQLPAQLARWLDALDETGRWALLKLVTGGLRIGVSARLAKTAAAALGDKDADEIELIWPGLRPPYLELFAWLEGRADKPAHARSGAVPPADAGARARGRRSRRARSRRLHGGMEMGRHPRAGGGRRDEDGRHRRRGSIRAPARTSPGAFPIWSRRCGCRRAIDGELADHARRPRAVLQRAAAAAQPQDRDAEAARRVSRASARLRSARRRRRGPARAALRRAPRAARSIRRPARRSAHRPLAARSVRDLGRARRRPRRSGRGRRRRRCRRGRRRDAQAPRRALRARPAEGPVVEMEARSVRSSTPC